MIFLQKIYELLCILGNGIRYINIAMTYPSTNEWEYCVAETKMYIREKGSMKVVKRDMTDQEHDEWLAKQAW